MTAPTTPNTEAPKGAAENAAEPGSAVAKSSAVAHPLTMTKDDLASLTPEQRQAIAQRKNQNIVSAQLAGTNWGKGLDEQTRRAVGDWGARNGIDVTTEIFVLGGNIYLNAQFYLNRLVGLIHRGHVLDYSQELIQPDPRLDAIVAEPIADSLPADLKAIALEDRADAFREIRRRRRLRIEHGAPDVAPAGCPPAAFAIGLTTLRLAAMPNTPIRGVKWAPHDSKDPIGKEYPQETALTRSARRALKQCVTHIPELARWVDGSEDDAAHTVAVALREFQAKAEQRDRAAITPGDTGRPVATADYLPAGVHREDVTKMRGPVAVTPAPVEDVRRPVDRAWVAGETEPKPGDAMPSHETDGDLFDTKADADRRAFEEQLGPDGPNTADDEIDDMATLTAAERAEQDEFRNRRRA